MLFEGKMTFKDTESYAQITMNKLIPIKYVNHNNRPTVMYPANPNGSPGIYHMSSANTWYDGKSVSSS